MTRSMTSLTLALLCLCASAQSQNLDAEAKKGLAVAGAAVGKAIVSRDVAALEQLWAPQLLINGPNNQVLTRAEVFDAIKRGQLEYEGRYQTRIEKVEFFGNTAITMGEDTLVPASGPDKDKTIHRRSTNIWQYADGKWTMIARQATIYDPAARHY